ncbi:MAG: hypothetical protein JW996_00220 [Candidatus Cloacimonetes bacterium]|nr:hypothetical protein [Candidatus Cloacimonadota bacterium]
MSELIIVIGAYGSGKSEYAINHARKLHTAGSKVALADLDVVNPYFRSRDMVEEFSHTGIEVIAPPKEYHHTDLPMISPRVMGFIQNLEYTVILDVGGDPAGCRTLARFLPVIEKRGYQMHYVVNTRRPFTSNVDEINQMADNLEEISHLKITELVCNTNLMEFTNTEIIQQGIEILSKVALSRKIKFGKFLVLDRNSADIPGNISGKTRYILTYSLRKPWEVNMGVGI